MTKTQDEVLAELFNPEVGAEIDDKAIIETSPKFEDMRDFADLLKDDPGEEKLQLFLESHPQFLISFYGMGDSVAQAFLVKPPVGVWKHADFALVYYDQGGARIKLIEIEKSCDALFTKKDTPAKSLQFAMGQIRDWHEWITLNKQTFVRDTIDYVMQLPEYPARAQNNSFRRGTAERFERGWKAFGGDANPSIGYEIVIGRWANLSTRHRKRLLFLNQQDNNLHYIYTYDQLARRAFDRPTRGY